MQKISVVVPVYNQARYLAACLDSLWFQHWPEIEIIVVDDASPDDAKEVLAAYQRDVAGDCRSFASRLGDDGATIERETHPRYPAQGRAIKILTHERNRGLAAALNTGFAAATGELCTYVPADDTLAPTMLEELALAIGETGADFAYCDMLLVDASGRVSRTLDLPDYSFARCFSDWYLCGVAKLYKTSLHHSVGYYDETLLAHDHELFLRFAMSGARFTHVPKRLMYRLDHDDRQVDIHAPDNWSRLLEESKALVLQARRFLAQGGAA